MYRLDSTDSLEDLGLGSCEYNNTSSSSTKARKSRGSVTISCSIKLYCLTFIIRLIFLTLSEHVTINEQVSNYKYFANYTPKF